MPAEELCTLRLEAQADLPCIERVHDLVEELWTRVPDIDPTDRYSFETAVIEVVGNIVEHGGPDVRLRLSLTAAADRVEAQFCDTGRVVELDALADRVVGPLAETGRGIALARTAADDIVYRRTGSTNHWRVLKRRAAG